ncbi:MAG: hypothetical protein ACYDH6_08775 [Acidimicrobiales bacterium]
MWRAGQLDLQALITSRVPLERINDGLDDLINATGLRTVVDIRG